jgi:hypothetical protein
MLAAASSGDLNTFGAFWSNAVDFLQLVWFHLNNVKDVASEGLNQLLGINRSDPADHPPSLYSSARTLLLQSSG